MSKEFKMVKLGDIAKIRTGKLDANASSDAGIYPFFTCSREPLKISSYSYDCECVLVAGNGDLNVKYFEGKFDAYQRTYIIETNDLNELSMRYLYYFIDSKMDFIRSQSIGGVIKYIKLGDLTSLKLPLHLYSKQQEIAAMLDKASELMEKRKAQLAELDTLAESIFYDMFGDPVTNEKGWTVSNLGSVAQIGTGGTPDRKKYDEYYEGEIPWVKTTEVQNCIISDTEEKITNLAVSNSNCKLYPVDTILLAMYGQGKTRGQVAKLAIEATTNQACAAIITNNSVCNGYIYNFLHLSYSTIRAMGRGGNQENLNLSLVKSISVPLPPLQLQQQFAKKIKKIEEQKQKVKAALKESEDLFQRLMQDMFNPK